MIMSSFFQEIDVVGLENIPTEGPLIICANHNNQFVDGLVQISQKLLFLINSLAFVLQIPQRNRIHHSS